MSQDNYFVREKIYYYLKHKNEYIESKFISEVKELKYDLPEKILLNIFYFKQKNKQIDTNKIRHLIHDYLIEKLQQSTDSNIFRDSIRELTNIFLPNCKYTTEQLEEFDFLNKLCEGSEAGEHYLLHSYYIDKEFKCSECKGRLNYKILNEDKKEFIVECENCRTSIEKMQYFCPDCNKQLQLKYKNKNNLNSIEYICPKCSQNEENKAIPYIVLEESRYSKPYLNLNYVECPICHSKDLRKENNTIICDKCLIEIQVEKRNIFYCQSKICGDPNYAKKKYFEPSKLTIQNIVINRQVVMLASWLNKYLHVLHNAYCNECKRPLAPKLNANRKELVRYKATKFECTNIECSAKAKPVYLNNCSNKFCKALIDSRITKIKCNNGFYICKECYSCCNNYHFARDGRATKGHLEQNIMYCPDCGCRLIISKFAHNILYCANCKQEKEIIYAHRIYNNWEELETIRRKKFNEKPSAMNKRRPIIK